MAQTNKMKTIKKNALEQIDDKVEYFEEQEENDTDYASY